MNKLSLIEMLRAEAGLNKSEAAAVVKTFFDEMSDALGKGDRVEIRGLCSFFVKEYKSYTGRNPKTGEKVKIKPKKLPFFKCGTELKRRVNAQLSQNKIEPDQQNGKDRRYHDATILSPDQRSDKGRRRN